MSKKSNLIYTCIARNLYLTFSYITFLIGRLSEIYLDGGAGLNFASLFDYIAENFPKDKTKRLLDFIRCKFILSFIFTHYLFVTSNSH